MPGLTRHLAAFNTATYMDKKTLDSASIGKTPPMLASAYGISECPLRGQAAASKRGMTIDRRLLKKLN